MQLIKNARIVDPASPLNGKKRDILIKRGEIISIKNKIEAAGNTKIIDAKGSCVSIGWMDVGTQIGDPGFEHREDLQSAAQAAAQGGFTALACLPNTAPAIHSKSEINYILKNTEDELVDFYPIGAISRDCAGKDLAELYDMNQVGAVAFSDGHHNIQDTGLMLRALEYAKAFDGLVMNQPYDQNIAHGAQMHEGMVSTSLGMRGFPSLGEELMVQRDLYLLEYSNSRLHVSNISTERSVALLKQAKSNGLNVSASVPAFNLIFEDEILTSFDTHYKVFPPLREKNDLKALRRGLKNGTIALISSNHVPLDEEAKNLEFPYADFGAIGLETTFSLCHTHLVNKKELSLDELIQILAINPRKVLGLPVPALAEGAPANLTLFDPQEAWTLEDKHLRSKSRNTPFIGTTFQGRVKGVFNNGQFILTID